MYSLFSRSPPFSERSPMKWVCEEKEEQRSERIPAVRREEWSVVCDDEVKLQRAQGECLGIRSR